MAIRQKSEEIPATGRILLAGAIALFALLLLGSIEYGNRPEPDARRVETARTVGADLPDAWQEQAEREPMLLLELSCSR